MGHVHNLNRPNSPKAPELVIIVRRNRFAPHSPEAYTRVRPSKFLFDPDRPNPPRRWWRPCCCSNIASTAGCWSVRPSPRPGTWGSCMWLAPRWSRSSVSWWPLRPPAVDTGWSFCRLRPGRVSECASRAIRAGPWNSWSCHLHWDGMEGKAGQFNT